MKRATITISDRLELALEAYLKDQEVAPSLTRLMQTALGDFLSARGYGGSASGSTSSRGRAPVPRPSTARPMPQPRPAEVEVVRPQLPDEDETDTTLL